MSAHPQPPAQSALPADRLTARSTARPPAGAHRSRALVARLDNLGDVLLTGPAVRAVAARADVVFLCGPRGRAAVDLLPGVGHVIEWEAPWIDPEPHPVSAERCRGLVAQVQAAAPTSAALLGSSHQSPLPLALLLRLAGVERLAAVSHDYAGSLLDHRIPGDPDVHEVERSLRVVRALGFPAPGDDRLAVRAAFEREARPPARHIEDGPYVAVHPGASVPARTLPAARWRDVVGGLVAEGWPVVVTGGAADRGTVARVVAGRPGVTDVAGTSLAELAGIFAGATAVVTGNTGPMHLAAAVGAPVVAVFAPTVPVHRWHPWRVPHVVVGDQGVPCAGCRHQRCPLPVQLCLAHVSVGEIVAAVETLAPARTAGRPPEAAAS
jgi:ADP-heptose:LPS heptosyltransferase